MMEEILDILNAVEDEELEIQAPITRWPRRIRDRVDHFEIWNELEFFNRFRMTKNTASIVLELIQYTIQSRTMKNQAVSPWSSFSPPLHLPLPFGVFLTIWGSGNRHGP